MALPLKSGADLYNQQLIRAAVWNYSADGLDPSEYATGLMYFNTNPSSNMYQKLRFRTATDWKTIAFAEDLDVATNKDFKALKEKVELLSGEVDTDAIINNMKEVTAFLEGFAEDANLMSVLDGKLDKSGGTMTGTISVGDFTAFGQTGGNFYLGTPAYPLLLRSNGTTTINGNTLLHSGNVGDYALKTNGSNAMTSILRLKGGYLIFLSADGSKEYGAYNVNAVNNAPIYLYNGAWKTIAFTEFTNSQELQWQDASGNAQNVLFLDGYNDLILGKETSIAGYRTRIQGNSVELRYGTAQSTGLILNSSGYVTIGGSDLAGTSAKLHVDGKVFADTQLQIGTQYSPNIDYGLCVYNNIGLFRTSSSQDTKTVGHSNGAAIRLSAYDLGNYKAGGELQFGLENKVVGVIKGEYSHWSKDIYASLNFYTKDNSTDEFINRMSIRYDGKIGVGLTDPSAQFHVSQDIVANGTIACKGVAAEGSMPVGTVDKWAGSIAIGTKTQTYTHGLGTTDITVAIYEKNGNEWVQILTDVDIVNANTIRVTFGANTTVEHRIVVMG